MLRRQKLCHLPLLPIPWPVCPWAQIAQRGLVVIPLSYTISGKEHLCLAPEGYDSAAFFQTMKLRGRGLHLHGSAPSVSHLSKAPAPFRPGPALSQRLLRPQFLLSVRLHGGGTAAGGISPAEAPDCGLPLLLPGQGLLVLRAFDLRERGMCLEDHPPAPSSPSGTGLPTFSRWMT